MRLCIISDGTRTGTKIVNENGEEIEGVTKIDWHFSQDEGQVWAVLTMGDVPCEATTGGPEPNNLAPNIL